MPTTTIIDFFAIAYTMAQQEGQINVKDRIEIREPHKWAVIFWNDDFTTMEFVVKVLTEVFLKGQQESEQIMMRVHQEGQASVGVYSYDLAVTRTKVATSMAREAGFPLKITYKEV